MEIVIRLIIALAIVSASIMTYMLWSRLVLVALRRRTSRRATPKGLENLRKGVPAILYFTSPDCVPCRTVQIPAINALLEQFGDQLQLIKIDATEHPEVADYWGVLSVPATFIIDGRGQPRRVNHGVASAAKLRQQFRDIGVFPGATNGSSLVDAKIKSLGITRTCEKC